MKKAICILISIAGAAGTAAAQPAPNSEYTWGHRNGRYWNTASFSTKLGFVVGMSEGVRWVDSESAKFVGPGTFGDAIKSLDGFFANPANLNIPILAAQGYLVEQVKEGVTSQQMEVFLSLVRRNFVPGTMTVPDTLDEGAEAEKPVLPQRSKI